MSHEFPSNILRMLVEVEGGKLKTVSGDKCARPRHKRDFWQSVPIAVPPKFAMIANTHLYLMERALEREGETRPIYEILRSLATSLELADFFPWGSVEEVLDAILDHPTTGHATVASLRAV